MQTGRFIAESPMCFRAEGQRSRPRRMLRLLAAIVGFVLISLIIPIENEAASAESIMMGTVLADDYDRGVAEGKPIVVIFYDITTSRYDADVLSTEIVGSAKLEKLAGSAVWSFADISKDMVARNIAKALGITEFPTISVLRPDGSALDETSRIVGHLPIGTTEIGVMRGIEKASQK